MHNSAGHILVWRTVLLLNQPPASNAFVDEMMQQSQGKWTRHPQSTCRRCVLPNNTAPRSCRTGHKAGDGGGPYHFGGLPAVCMHHHHTPAAGVLAHAFASRQMPGISDHQLKIVVIRDRRTYVGPELHELVLKRKRHKWRTVGQVEVWARLLFKGRGVGGGVDPPPTPSGAECLEVPNKILDPNRLAPKAPEESFVRPKAHKKIWLNLLGGGGAPHPQVVPSCQKEPWGQGHTAMATDQRHQDEG